MSKNKSKQGLCSFAEAFAEAKLELKGRKASKPPKPSKRALKRVTFHSSRGELLMTSSAAVLARALRDSDESPRAALSALCDPDYLHTLNLEANYHSVREAKHSLSVNRESRVSDGFANLPRKPAKIYSNY